MKKPSAKTRKTLAQKIESAPDLLRAGEIARVGREITPLERLCEKFLEVSEKKNQAKFDYLLPLFHTSREQIAEEFSRELLLTVFKRDGGALRSLADLIETLQVISPIAGKDSTRLKVLQYKGLGELLDKKLSVRALARLVYGNPENGYAAPKSEDGYAALRRLCKKLKFPIAPETKGRRKKQTPKPKRRGSKS